MSPLSLMPSERDFFDPPNKRHAMAFLISSEPKIAGATEEAIFSKTLGSFAIALNASSSSDE